MPEFPIPSARILLVSQIQGGRLPPAPSVRYAYASGSHKRLRFSHLSTLYSISLKDFLYSLTLATYLLRSRRSDVTKIVTALLVYVYTSSNSKCFVSKTSAGTNVSHSKAENSPHCKINN